LLSTLNKNIECEVPPAGGALERDPSFLNHL